MWAVSRLHRQTAQLAFDSRSLQLSQQFETDLLIGARSTPQARRSVWQNTAKVLIPLQEMSGSKRESAIVLEMAQRFADLQRAPENTALLAAALSAAREHHDLNEQEIAATLRSGDQIDHVVDVTAKFAALIALLSVGVGGMELWTRVLLPVLAITRAARAFGDGDLSVRCRVAQSDEIGQLAKTFNDMATAIQERERERLLFTASVAHDLKNPLVVVGGAAQLLKKREYNLTEDERQEWLQAIQDKALLMEDIIGDMTAQVQISTGMMELHCEEMELLDWAREYFEKNQRLMQTHSLRFYDETEGAATRVSADCRQLRRVLQNLISNAAKYSPRGKEIGIIVSREGERAKLKVRDEGEGISEAEASQLFQPFARLERTQTMASGTGLGLASCRKIITAHGGEIGVQSTPGVGSTFEICLPILSALKSNDN